MVIRWDISADDIQSKMFNGSSWDVGWTNIDTNAPDNTTYDGTFGATVDKTTGNVYWKRSTDRMTTWGVEQGPINTTADDIYGARVI